MRRLAGVMSRRVSTLLITVYRSCCVRPAPLRMPQEAAYRPGRGRAGHAAAIYGQRQIILIKSPSTSNSLNNYVDVTRLHIVHGMDNTAWRGCGRRGVLTASPRASVKHRRPARYTGLHTDTRENPE